jgi:hypothetical protein
MTFRKQDQVWMVALLVGVPLATLAFWAIVGYAVWTLG